MRPWDTAKYFTNCELFCFVKHLIFVFGTLFPHQIWLPLGERDNRHFAGYKQQTTNKINFIHIFLQFQNFQNCCTEVTDRLPFYHDKTYKVVISTAALVRLFKGLLILFKVIKPLKIQNF